MLLESLRNAESKPRMVLLLLSIWATKQQILNWNLPG